MSKELITLSQHIVDMERIHPGATGEFTSVILTIEEVSKIIRQRVVNAGLNDILGKTGAINVHGETVQKLDVFANEMIIKTLGRRGYIGVMASEELEQVVQSEYVIKGLAMWRKYQSPGNIADVEETVKQALAEYRKEFPK